MFLPFPQWVDELIEKDQLPGIDYAQENPVYRHNVDVAHKVQQLRPVLVDEAIHWAMGQILRAILEDERRYWSRVANPNNRRP